MNAKTILAALAAIMFGVACTQSEPEVEEPVSQNVTASIVDNGAATAWTKSDVIGVYTDASENNVKYTTSSAGTSVAFTASTEVKGTPMYAYYPYNSNNSSKKATGLAGTVAQDQTKGAVNYMYGVQTGTNNDGDVTYNFQKVLADVVFTVETAGSALEGQEIVSLVCKVTRNGAAVPVCGDFSFSAADGAFSYTGNTTYNEFTTVSKAVVFPTVKPGDLLTVVVKSAKTEVTVELPVDGEVVAGGYYPVTVTLPEAVVEPEQPETPSEPETPVVPETPAVAGTFTVATYNVDGLPNKISLVSINGDGPGSSGTKNISQKIASDNWDFVGFSEDFAYHTELTSALSKTYTFGKYRGSISSKALYSTIDTDGLGFASRNATCSFSNEKIVEFTSDYGGLTSGANTCVKKGFRHYVVTLADGTELDVIITHMNTYSSSGSGHINAQHAQLKQMAQYVNSIRGNKRPIIIMGDTNCRYTRHDFQTYFWGVLNSDLVAVDPWVEYQWDGVYPTYGGKSLMVSDATGTDSKTDIICENTQKGEVVDKVIYINNPDSPVQIKANSYLRDYDGYNGLADHMPIVVEFSYTK